MIEVRDLNYSVKKSGKSFSINNINFKLEDGYIMSLLGKNGSGKTTLLSLIYGALSPNSGEVVWNGKKINIDNRYDFRNDVAYIGDMDWCFGTKSINENVKMLKLLYKNFDETIFEEYIEYFDLNDVEREKDYADLSTGKMMQFQIAFALARKPKLLLMDEPMANLDPVIKVDLMEMLQQKVMQENMSIIISTHLVEDISDMTDYIGILDDGNMKEFGDREKIFEKYEDEDLRKLLLHIRKNSEWR